MFFTGQQLVRGQQRSHAPHFASAHGIGLAGKGKRSRSRLAYVPRDQVQADEPNVFVYTNAALVQAHGPHCDKTLGISNVFCYFADVFEGNAAFLRSGAERSFEDRLTKIRKSVTMFFYKMDVDLPVFYQDTSDRIVEVKV